MKFKELLLRINHRQSLENSICDHGCVSCEYFDECQNEARNDPDFLYDEVSLTYTRNCLIAALLISATCIGCGIYGIISIVRFFL